LLWTWWRGDPLPEIPPLAGFSVEASGDDRLLLTVAHLGQEETLLTMEEVVRRRRSGHQAYVARLDAAPVAYGWSATREATFGPQRTAFSVPDGNRYLWSFVTLPAWRGRGLYPRLLQAIIANERGAADRFWILHRWDNAASARGIEKAGFQAVAQVHALPEGAFGLAPVGATERAPAGAELLGLPILSAKTSTAATSGS